MASTPVRGNQTASAEGNLVTASAEGTPVTVLRACRGKSGSAFLCYRKADAVGIRVRLSGGREAEAPVAEKAADDQPKTVDGNKGEAASAAEPKAAAVESAGGKEEKVKEEKAAATGTNGESKPADDDSDQDEPLSKKKVTTVKKPVADDDSDDDLPLKSKMKVDAPTQKPADDDSSDDDKPLAAKLPPKKPAVPKEAPKAKSVPVKKRKAETLSSEEEESSSEESSDSEDEKPLKKKTKKEASGRPKGSPSKPKASSSKFSSKSKGLTNKDWLIERYLVRWWYCEEWPSADRPRPADLSEDFVEMKHYPYIYRNEKTGQVISKRNKDNMPPCKEVPPFHCHFPDFSPILRLPSAARMHLCPPCSCMGITARNLLTLSLFSCSPISSELVHPACVSCRK